MPTTVWRVSPRSLLGTPLDAAPGSQALAGAAHAAHGVRAELAERLRTHDMEGLLRDLEVPLAEVLAEMELAGMSLDVAALGALSHELGSRPPTRRQSMNVRYRVELEPSRAR